MISPTAATAVAVMGETSSGDKLFPTSAPNRAPSSRYRRRIIFTYQTNPEIETKLSKMTSDRPAS